MLTKIVHAIPACYPYHRSSVVILHEATSALDMPTEAKLLEVLRSLVGQLTIAIAAHLLSAVVNCDQLIDLAEEIPAVWEIGG
jgi:ABC-type multidrug transport system fused ATPase/permease subunit